MKKRVILIFAFLFLVLTILFFSSFVLKEETNSSFSISSFIKGITSRVIQFIIPASNAEHLDSSRRFISDIYEEIKELDGIWSEEISEEHYVRITFERNLSSNNDITVYPEIISGNPKIEVYEENKEEKIAEFSSINSNEYNKVYLTNLVGEQNTFDLRIVSGSLKFDYIVDPVEWTNELMINGGFEWGNLTGWTISGSYWEAGVNPPSGSSGPQAGTYCAYNNASSSGLYIYQDVNLTSYLDYIDSGDAIINASGWGASSEANYDYTTIKMYFLFENKTIISTPLDAGNISSNDNWWRVSLANYPVPENTRYIRIWGNTYETGYDSGSLDSFSVKLAYNSSGEAVLQITNPTTLNPLSVSVDDNVSIYFNYSVGGANKTSGVSLEKILFGGIEAEIVTSEASPDNTDKVCGNDCSGGAYTYGDDATCTNNILADSCSGGGWNCDGGDTVVDIWLNGTSFREDDAIYVTMQFNCYTDTDEVAIWYYNGDDWYRKLYDDECDYYSATGNYTIEITINSSTATQYIRGMVTYDEISPTEYCCQDEYADNDDISFSVVSSSEEEFAYVSNVGWQANVTSPSGLSGYQNLFVNATRYGTTRNDTETNAINYGGADETPPYFTSIPANASLWYGNESLGVDFDADDAVAFDSFSINDTAQFSINSTGWLSNATSLGIGHYMVNVTINDTSNNINWTFYTVEINKSNKNCDIFFNETSPLEYPKKFTVWADCSSGFVLKRNNTVITNNSEQSLEVGAYNFSVLGNDTANYSNYYNEEQFIIAEAVDSTLPIYNSVSHNSTSANSLTLFAVNISDETALNPNGQYIFSTNNTGTWTNDSAINFTATPSWANVTKTLNSTIGIIVGYRWYFNDTAGNLNFTDVYALTTIDSTPPTITFEEPPTPENDSAVSIENQTIVANISDASNTSAWLDFNRDLVGYWAMDYYNSTGIFDNSSYGHFAIFGGGASTSDIRTGKRGNAMEFEDAGYLVAGSSNDMNVVENFTISAWINVKDSDSYNGIFTRWGNVFMDVSDGTDLNMGNAVSPYPQVSANGAITTNTWYHVVGTHNSTDYISIYIDGEFEIGGIVDIPSDTSSTVHIGSWDTQYDIFNGTIDEVMLFNRTLSETEVKALYHSKENKFNATIYNLEEGRHNYTVYAIDEGGNTNNSGERNFVYTLTDEIPPYFTNIPENASLWYGNESLGVDFDADDNVDLDSYFINDTTQFSINSTGWLSNATSLAIGNYMINVTINDTFNNINWTLYTVEINSSNQACNVLFNETSPLEYPSLFTVYTDCGSAFTLYRNGTTITNNTAQNNGAGYYNFSVQRIDTENYTNMYDEEFFTINSNSEICEVLYNETSPLAYPKTFTVWADCTSGFVLKRNNTVIANNSEQSLAIGAYNFSMLRNDTANYSYIYNESQFRITDESFPYFTTIPSDEFITYGENWTGVDFDATDAISFDTFSINDTRFTINSTGFLDDTYILGAGDYAINVTINDTSNNINWTIYNFTVNKAVLTGSLTNSETWTETYPTEVTIGLSESNTGDSDVTYTVWRDETDLSSGETITLGHGTYDYVLNSTGGENYTSNASIDAETLTINVNEGPCNVLFNETSPVVYPGKFTVYTDCNSGDFTLYRNGTIVGNGSTQELAVGYYNFSVIRDDNGNYTNYYDEEDFLITETADETPPYFTTIPSDESITYGENWSGVDFDATDAISFDTFSINDTRFTINSEGFLDDKIILGAGDYTINVTINDTSNNINWTIYNFTVNKATLTGDLTNSETWTETYPTEVTIGLSESNTGASDVTYIVWRDETNLGTGETITLGYGTYDYVLNSTGGANYTSNASINAETLTINENTGACNVLFNETSPLGYPKTFKVYTDCTTAFTLYRNGTIVSNNSEQSLAIAAYNFSVMRTDSTNYSNYYDEEQFIISEAEDETPPYFTDIPEDDSITYGDNWTGVDFDADDETGFDSFSVNDTRFTINSTGFLDDTYILGAGDYAINVTINDTSNNINWTIYNFTVNKAVLTGSLTNTQSWTETYPTEVTIGLSESNTGDSDVTYTVWRDETDLSSGETITLGYGTYDYVLNSTGGENYTSNASIDAETLTINKKTPIGSISGTSPITSGTAADIQGSESNTGDSDVEYKLYREGAPVTNPDTEVLGIGSYNYIYNTTGGQNYTSVASLDTFNLVVEEVPVIMPFLRIKNSRLTLKGGNVLTFKNS